MDLFLIIAILLLFLFTAIFAFFALVSLVVLRKNILIGFVCLICAIGFCIGALYVREYRIARESAIELEKHILESNIKDVYSHFEKLSDENKERFSNMIYKKFYSRSLKDKIDFVKTYSRYDLKEMDNIKSRIDDEIIVLYNKAEEINTPNAWRVFTDSVPTQYLTNYAGKKLYNREFSKWADEKSAWQRVRLFNSESITKHFLAIYPNSEFKCEARKMILENQGCNIENPCDSSYVHISNASSSPMTFTYKGTFVHGSVDIGGYGSKTLKLPNGKYEFHTSGPSAHGTHENTILDGKTITQSYYRAKERRQ